MMGDLRALKGKFDLTVGLRGGDYREVLDFAKHFSSKGRGTLILLCFPDCGTNSRR